jgi:hypothetical protein
MAVTLSPSKGERKGPRSCFDGLSMTALFCRFNHPILTTHIPSQFHIFKALSF